MACRLPDVPENSTLLLPSAAFESTEKLMGATSLAPSCRGNVALFMVTPAGNPCTETDTSSEKPPAPVIDMLIVPVALPWLTLNCEGDNEIVKLAPPVEPPPELLPEPAPHEASKVAKSTVRIAGYIRALKPWFGMEGWVGIRALR